MKLTNRVKQLQVKLRICPECGRRQNPKTVFKVLWPGDELPPQPEGCPVCDRVVAIRIRFVTPPRATTHL